MIGLSSIERAATDIVETALRNGRPRAVYVLPTGEITHYPEGGALDVRIAQRHQPCLIGVYTAAAHVGDIVEDILEAMKR